MTEPQLSPAQVRLTEAELTALTRAVQSPVLSVQGAVERIIADRLAGWPAVTINAHLGEPTECRVMLRGHVVFDGVSRDALLRTNRDARNGD